MAQRDGLFRETITGIGKETTSGTQASTITRVHLVSGGILGSGFARTALEVALASPARHDNPEHALGAKVAAWGPLSWYLRSVPAASRLTASGSATALSHDLLWEHGYGRRYAAVGTTVTGAGSTTTAVDLTSATGRKVGELVMIGDEARRITAIASNTITVSPALSGIPAAGVVVRGLRCFVLPETRTSTLTIEQEHVAASAAAEQYRVLGAMGTLSLTFPAFGQLVTSTLAGQGTDFTGPGTLSSPSWSLGHSPADDDMGDCLAWQPRVYLDGTLYRTEVEGFEITIGQQIEQIPNGSTGTGIGGWIDTGGRQGGIAVSGKFRVRLDTDRVSDFDATTLRHLLIACDPTGGSTVLGGAFWEMHRAQTIARPVAMRLGQDRIGYEISWKALLPGITPGGSSAEEIDLARSPIIFGLT